MIEIDGIGRAVRLGGDKYDPRSLAGPVGRADHSVLQPSVNHDARRKEMNGEHRLVSLRKFPGPGKHQSGIHQRNVDADTAYIQKVTEVMHGLEIREIDLHRFHGHRSGQALYFFTDFAMSGPAGQDHVSATPRKLNGSGFAQAAVGAGHQAGPAVNPHIIGNRADFRVLRLPEVPDRGDQRAESRAVSHESGSSLHGICSFSPIRRAQPCKLGFPPQITLQIWNCVPDSQG